MEPFVGLLVIELRIMEAASLKDRRRIVRSLLDHLQRKDNASVLDLGPDGSWSTAVISAAVLAGSFALANARVDVLEKHIAHLENQGEFEVQRRNREVMSYGDISYRTYQQGDAPRNLGDSSAENQG
ncbi:DUF503 domain-containing protein [Aminiphilus sp.]|uniref:DUF503 domain-containing protein n=1 Tax=Aminiphilus sp. TaxID=1872488 RepID=UPI003420C29D